MVDNTALRGSGDRSRVAGGQDHEVQYFAEKHGLSTEQVRQLIAEHGNDRDALEAAAQQIKG
jgi:hypothetical protein